MPPTPQQTAAHILDVIPLIMHSLRNHMRTHHESGLSIPQFRALMFLYHHPEVSLSEVAEFLGLTLPSMSKLIDGLVNRELLTRQEHPEDRRRLCLALTPQGREILERAEHAAQACLAVFLEKQTPEERTRIVEAMELLRLAFTQVSSKNNSSLQTKSVL